MKQADFGRFLVSAALYRVGTIEDPDWTRTQGGDYLLALPRVVDRNCPTCGPTKWELRTDEFQPRIRARSFTQLLFTCRNCHEASFGVWVLWSAEGTRANVEKLGQYPKLAITVPKAFERALGARRDLYVKGMTLRHNAYGIGALTYFRRLIEDTTDEMLDLLEGAMSATGAAPEAVEALKKAKGSTRFEDKVKIAADVMPANLRPNNINPFADLYQLVSIGLHDRTDSECCDIVDMMDESLKLIYAQLKTHMEDAEVYEAAVAKISTTLGKFKKGDFK